MKEVTVVLPFHREPDIFLHAAIQSVQNSKNCSIELILIDDRVKPSTPFKFKEAKILKGGDLGYAESLNLGITASNCEFLGIMNSDDLISLNRFAAQIDALTENNKDLSTTRIKKFGRIFANTYTTGEQPSSYMKEALSLGPYFANASLLGNTKFMKQHLFETDAMSDWIFALKFYKDNHIYINDELYFYRQHKLQTTNTSRLPSSHFFNIWSEENSNALPNPTISEIKSICFPELKTEINETEFYRISGFLNNYLRHHSSHDNRAQYSNIVIRRLLAILIHNPKLIPIARKIEFGADYSEYARTALKLTIDLSTKMLYRLTS